MSKSAFGLINDNGLIIDKFFLHVFALVFKLMSFHKFDHSLLGVAFPVITFFSIFTRFTLDLSKLHSFFFGSVVNSAQYFILNVEWFYVGSQPAIILAKFAPYVLSCTDIILHKTKIHLANRQIVVVVFSDRAVLRIWSEDPLGSPARLPLI